MSWLYWLSQITPSEQSLVGEKIFILSQLLQREYPIIPGFVVGSSLLTDFLSNVEDCQALSTVDIDNYRTLQSLAQQIRQTIIDAKFPQTWQDIILEAIEQLNCSHVIIRPSLVVSSHQEKIDQRLLRAQICETNTDAIVWGVKKVWSELFTAKSIFYWRKLNIEFSQVKLALLMQPIQNTLASGRIELHKDCIYIEAIWGLGHGLDYGAVQPDIYLVNRQNANLIKQQIGTKNIYYHLKNTLDTLILGEDCLVTDLVEQLSQETVVLSDEQIKSLVQLVEKITSEKPEIAYFQWSIPHDTPREKNNNEFNNEQALITETIKDSQFYFHQLDSISNSQINYLDNFRVESPQVLLTGIGAAPGKIKGQVFVHNSENNNYDQIANGSILVTNNIALSDISLLKNLGGIIIETGSLTCHTAILARELGIPAIVNSKNATTILQTGESVILDGDRGTVYLAESVTSKEIDLNISEGDKFDKFNDSEIFNYPISTRLMVNLSQDKIINDVASLPIDGIGLLRSDFMLLNLLNDQTFGQLLQANSQPYIIDYLVKIIKKFVAKFNPRPIFYRSLDIPLPQLFPNNQNFTSGNRGTTAYLQDPSFFDLELSALARLVDDGFTNINLVLPFVRTVEEFIFCRDRFAAKGLANNNSCQLWIMAEVPSVILLIPEYAKAGVQGLVIGTGDLTRLLLGLDREQIDLNQYYNDNAVQKAISQIISLAQNQQIPCSICLHGTNINPNLIDNLIRWGITSITVESQAIRETYRMISRAERRLLLAKTRRNT